MRHPHLMLAAASALTLSVSSAIAAPETLPAPNHHEFRFDFGLGSPVGQAGLTWTTDLADSLRFETGFGFSVLAGFQLSLMPKLALGGGAGRFTMGIGPSLGTPLGSGTTTWWINADLLGYSRRFESGLAFAVNGGLDHLLSGRTHGSAAFTGASAGATLAQLRLGLGYWR